MGRKPLPSAVLKAQGTFRKDRHGDISDKPTPSPLGDPPDGLAGDELACWHEIVRDCVPGVLANSDSAAVEITARLLAESRRDFEGFSAAKIGKLISLFAELGMTPSARTKVPVNQPEEPDPFQELMARRAALNKR